MATKSDRECLAACPSPGDCPVAATHQRWLTCLMMALIGIGAAWRLTRYFLCFPIWGDEASLAVNFLSRDYLGLLGGLDHLQVAPILFLWLEKTALLLLGPSELTLRLWPLLAGLASLLLFWRLCVKTLPPLAAVLAVGLLAMSYYPVRHSCEVKPYAFDLFCSLLLLTPAVGWLREPNRPGWLAWLAAAAPLTIAASYTAVFIAAAVALTLAVPVWKEGNRKAWVFFAAFNLLVMATFLLTYLTVGQAQAQSQGAAQEFFQDYWQSGFPPAEPLPFLGWLAQAHVGEMLAYPVGGNAGASVLTLLLCLAGAWTLVPSRRWTLLALCTLPFGLGLLAALLHRYPYGASARLAQHLAPLVCMLAGLGLASGIEWLARSVESRRRWATALAAGLAILGIACLVRDVVRPYKTPEEWWARRMVEDVAQQAGDDPLIILHPANQFDAVFEWYLRVHGGRLLWPGTDLDELADAPRFWCLRLDPGRAQAMKSASKIPPPPSRWQLEQNVLHEGQPVGSGHPVPFCRIMLWTAAETVEGE